MNIRENLEENIEIYAGMTIQKRAIVDVRDCLKPSARLSIYSQYIDKLFPNKPFEKSAVSVASAMKHFYPYGDAALYSMLARMGKPYAMRYKLEDFQGSTGDITEDDNQAAMRYTNMRLSKLAMYLFKDVEKNTISKWFDSYTDKEQYPSVLPTKGYYNIVNGSMGLAYAIAASIPQFNLREVNEAMIKLLQNPNIPDDEIICMPDFATGCNLINKDEVKESLKNGHGSACKLRANVEFNEKERALIFTNTPYSVYTSTITEQIQKIKLSDDNPGIERVLDQSTNDAYIKVLLTKTANPNKVVKFLFKNTSLQNHYGINLIMLDKGKTPKLFTWKEALQAHIDHEKEIYRRGFLFDLDKITHRIMIIQGLLKAIDAIDEVIATIKSSASTAAANSALQKLLEINEEQAKAILEIKLSRLAKLEIKKLVDEKEKLELEAKHILEILNSEILFNEELIKGWKEVADKFGDERRTKILNIENETEEPSEIKQLILNVTNKNNLFVEETSALYTSRRRSVGSKFKLDKDEYVINAASISTNDRLLFFTNNGYYYSVSATELTYENKVPIETIIPLKSEEKVCACVSFNLKDTKKFIIFVTKKGYIKKSELSEYNTKRKTGVVALGLESDDTIISISFTNEEKIGIFTERSNLMICETKDIRPIGRTSRGVKGIKLKDSDTVISAKIIPNNIDSIVTITKNGLIKQISKDEIQTTNRYTTGTRIHKIVDDCAADFQPLLKDDELIVCSNKTQTKISQKDIPELSKQAIGVKSLKLNNDQKIIKLIRV